MICLTIAVGRVTTGIKQDSGTNKLAGLCKLASCNDNDIIYYADELSHQTLVIVDDK
jgi:hypothetical protein